MLTSENLTQKPDQLTCKHVFDGKSILFNDSGEIFNESDVPDHDTDPEEYHKFYKKNKITGGAVCCSFCDMPFSPPFFT